ncbi:hypothetical protein POSPLADRAFT_1160602, partial [Postia placenta MAD-698-R-SB12]
GCDSDSTPPEYATQPLRTATTAVIAAVCVVAACTLLLIVLWRTWRVRRPSPPLLQVSLEKPRLWDILSVRADAKAEPWTMWARMLPLSVMRPGEVLLGCTPPRQDGYASKPSRTDGILQVVVVIEMPAQRRYKGQKAQGASASGQSIQDMGGLWNTDLLCATHGHCQELRTVDFESLSLQISYRRKHAYFDRSIDKLANVAVNITIVPLKADAWNHTKALQRRHYSAEHSTSHLNHLQ